MGGAGGAGAAGGAGGAGGSAMATVTSLSIGGASAELALDMTVQLSATATYSDGETGDVTSEVEWASSDTTIAAFNANSDGLLRGMSAGQVAVTATLGDVSSEPVQITVPEAEAVAALTATPAEISGVAGESFALVVQQTTGEEMTDVSATVSWASSDEAVVTIEEGVATIQGAGTASLTGTLGSSTVTIAVEGIACDYPANDGSILFQQTFPNLMWRDAYLPDGSQANFSMAQFYCSPRYAEKNTLIVVLGAGWCSPCSHFTQNILDPQSQDLIAMGAQILYLEAQDTDFNLADNRFAFRHIGNLIEEGPGVRVGDKDTLAPGPDGSWMEAPGYVQGQDIVTGFPSVWVLRKRDMNLIADQGRSNFYLPFSLIVADPEADWSDPPPPPFMSNCEEGEEELTEPNDTAADATRIEPGTYEGGICTGEPDFYRFVINGPWRATLDFDAEEGDLDMYVFNKRTGEAVRDENGMAVGSNGTGNQEVIDYQGPAILIVFGYNRSSANYTLTVEEL